ncbi:hypothetical protein MBGDF03_00362 [Thermoplasmatales archaeon SCGC AB-540-F20]|nr:hypothetical protein MBGDF03_00362 [Thermoplasmatales archaeon SCGC AB-540-F20]
MVDILNKKILIGSLVAVAILILVSFTGVVGYQTTKSSTIAKASPLFAVRSNRAIYEESEDIVCDYVGKGIDSNIYIPIRDNKQLTVQRFIDLVRAMDDDNYNKFIVQLVSHLEKQDIDNIDTIINLIKSIRSTKGNINVDNNANNGNYTWFENFSPTHCWFPMKYTLILLLATYALVLLIIIFIQNPTTFFTCSEWYCPT